MDGSSFALIFAPAAVRDLHDLSPKIARRIVAKARELETDPSPRGDTVKRTQGSSPLSFRLRAGDYRAIFRVDADRKRRNVVILRVIHRGELERALRELL